MDNTDLPLLKSLTDSIKKGERVVLLPPGIFFLISVIGLSILSTLLVTGATIRLFFSSLEIPQQVAIEFGGIGLFMVFVVFPGLMLTTGRKQFASWHRIFLFVTLFTAIALLIVDIINGRFLLVPLCAGIIASGTAWLITRSAGYILLTEFYYLLKRT